MQLTRMPYLRPLQGQMLGEGLDPGPRRLAVGDAVEAVAGHDDDVRMTPSDCPKANPRSRQARAAVRHIRHVPLRLVSTTASQPRSSISMAGDGNWPPRAVDQHVKPAMAGMDVVEDGLHSVAVPYVEDMRFGVESGLGHGGDHRGQPLFVPAGDDNPGAQARQQPGSRTADIATAAGDERHLAVEQAGREHRRLGGGIARRTGVLGHGLSLSKGLR